MGLERASEKGEEKTLGIGFKSVMGDDLAWAGGILAYDYEQSALGGFDRERDVLHADARHGNAHWLEYFMRVLKTNTWGFDDAQAFPSHRTSSTLQSSYLCLLLSLFEYAKPVKRPPGLPSSLPS